MVKIPNPTISYLVFGRVFDSLGNIISNAQLIVTTSVGDKTYHTNSDGIFLYDLAEVGYVSGEIVTVVVTEPFNNETKEHTFVVDGFWNEEDITLVLRTTGVNTTGYSPPIILHSVGKKPITSSNPLAVEIIGQSDIIDLVNNPQHEWNVTDNDGQPEDETVTMSNGEVYKRTFTYSTLNGMRVLTLRSVWVRQ